MPSVTAVQVEDHVFSPIVKAPATTKSLFLGGAGVRGLEIEGKFVKFTAIGVYLEDNAVDLLALKWRGKSKDELTESVEFFRDIVTGPFEKFTQVRMISTLTGKQYADKVLENCIAIWKSMGIYSDVEESVIKQFADVFEAMNFPPGASILFTQLPLGSLTVSFSHDGVFPETGAAVIENKHLSEAFLESIIGANGVSPAAKRSLAVRLSQLMNEFDNEVSLAPLVAVTEVA